MLIYLCQFIKYIILLDTFLQASQHLAFRFCFAHEEEFPNLFQLWIKHLHSDHMELAGVHISQFIGDRDFPRGPVEKADGGRRI